MAFPTGWSRKTKLTTDSTLVTGSADFTDFVVSIREDALPTGDNEIFDADGTMPALDGGGDIRFSLDAAGLTQLACEVVVFTIDNTPTNGVAVIWVKIPTLLFNSDMDIYVWWGKLGESQPGVGDAFGRNAVWVDFEAVLHLVETGTDGTSGEYEDSTGNGFTGQGGAGTAGRIPGNTTTLHPWGGVWADFDGSNDYILIENSGSAFDNSDGSISVWARYDSLTNTAEAMVSNRLSAQSNNYVDMANRTSASAANVHDGTGENNGGGATLSTNLVHFAMSWSGTRVTSYKDGVQHGEDVSIAGDGQFVTANPFLLATFLGLGSARSMNGKIGEAWFRLSQPTDELFATEFNSQNDPGAFWTVGTVEITLFDAGFNLGTITGLINQGVLVTQTGFSLGVDGGLTSLASAVSNVAALFGLGLSESFTALVITEASVSLGVTVNAAFAASKIVNAGLSLDVLVDIQLTGTGVILEFQVTDGRVVFVEIENRTVTITDSSGGRTVFILGE